MRMSDALIAPAVAGTMYACSAVVAARSLKKVQLMEGRLRFAATESLISIN